MEIITKSAKETFELGKKIGTSLKGGETLFLSGEMGAGKTTLIQGISEGVGIKTRLISPTFILMRKYVASKFDLYHVDLYRLEGNVDHDVRELGIYDLWGNSGNVFVIEWSEKLKVFPQKKYQISIDVISEDTRKITYEPIH